MHQEINQQRIHNISQMILEITEGNFAYRIPRTANDDELEALTVLVNWMAEEMKESVFHASFINPHFSYRYVVQSTFVLDNKFVIKDFSGNVPDLLGCNPNELLGKDFIAILAKESVSLLETLMAEILQNESYHTIVSFEFATSEKLVIPASCTISRIYKSTDVVICLFSAIMDNTMEKWTTTKKIFTAEEQKSHNYLDVKSTQAVYDYILANMDSTMPTLKELSHLFGTNEYKLKNSFRHLFKMTIHQFYNSERLNRSQLLIKYTKIPLKNIAIMAGFTNYPNFSRAFKIKFGCSPTDIEKQATIK